MKNLLDQIPQQLPQELFTELLKSDNIRIERIVSNGHISPGNGWYDQTENEWVMLLEGAAVIEYDTGELHNLMQLDFLLIPRNQKHKVVETSKKGRTLWLAIFFN